MQLQISFRVIMRGEFLIYFIFRYIKNLFTAFLILVIQSAILKSHYLVCKIFYTVASYPSIKSSAIRGHLNVCMLLFFSPRFVVSHILWEYLYIYFISFTLNFINVITIFVDCRYIFTTNCNKYKPHIFWIISRSSTTKMNSACNPKNELCYKQNVVPHYLKTKYKEWNHYQYRKVYDTYWTRKTYFPV